MNCHFDTTPAALESLSTLDSELDYGFDYLCTGSDLIGQVGSNLLCEYEELSEQEQQSERGQFLIELSERLKDAEARTEQVIMFIEDSLAEFAERYARLSRK